MREQVEPGAVVFSAIMRGLPANATLQNSTVGGALRAAVGSYLLPDGYPVDAVFISEVFDARGVGRLYDARDPVNRAGSAPCCATLNELMNWLGWADMTDVVESTSNATLSLSAKYEGRRDQLLAGSVQITFNLVTKTTDFEDVFQSTKREHLSGRAMQIGTRTLEKTVVEKLESVLGANSFNISMRVTSVTRDNLSFKRSRWRVFMDWIEKNAWTVIAVACGLCSCMVITLFARKRLAGRRGGAHRAARLRHLAAQRELEKHTRKWRIGWKKDFDAGGGMDNTGEGSDADAFYPNAPPGAVSAESLPSDAGSGGAITDFSAVRDALDVEVRGEPPSAPLQRSPLPPATELSPARLRALPLARVKRGVAVAAPLSAGAPLIPIALRPLRAKLHTSVAPAGGTHGDMLVARGHVVRGAAGRSHAARARASQAVRRQSPPGGAGGAGAGFEV